jgi:hypothetical protein
VEKKSLGSVVFEFSRSKLGRVGFWVAWIGFVVVRYRNDPPDRNDLNDLLMGVSWIVGLGSIYLLVMRWRKRRRSEKAEP